MNNYLVGPRIKLVKFTDCHITDQYIEWLNSHTINRYLYVGRLPISKDEINIKEGDKDLVFAVLSNIKLDSEAGTLVELNEYQEYIGTVSLHRIDWISRRGEIGYMIGSSAHWGIGMATEVVEIITNYGFSRLNLNKITASVVDYNIGSEKVLTKNGYNKYCTSPQEYYLEGKYLDVSCFYKLQEWHK